MDTNILEIYYMADESSKKFDRVMEGHCWRKKTANRTGTAMPVQDKICLRKRSLIETVNDGLKKICQAEHTRHRSFENFIGNMVAALVAYNFLPKNPPPILILLI
ncbi:hypothetical protein FACS1894181_02890 [Bacteroidia bacterium]|nr:hypothetical protein FACS1894181_02890 [Bacteroidia bacterium]